MVYVCLFILYGLKVFMLVVVAKIVGVRRGAARQTRRFWWLSAVSTDAVGQTRRLQRRGGVGPASSQCTYIVLVSITIVRLIVCST
jgi:hypothetical protein